VNIDTLLRKLKEDREGVYPRKTPYGLGQIVVYDEIIDYLKRQKKKEQKKLRDQPDW